LPCQGNDHPNEREPYPLSIDEQRLLFSELAGHLAKMAVFKVNTGLREKRSDRYVVLNRVAKSVIDGCRGEHPEFVFTRAWQPITRIYNSGWKAARRRASKRYASEFGRSCPFNRSACMT
jgi:hypothetical protein